MKRNIIYNVDVAKTARRLVLGCLLVFFMVGNIMAQDDKHYVIKYLDTIWVNPADHAAGIDHLVPHYLTHSLTDATTFGPNCIWYSPNNYNYYYMDGGTRKYLKAPLSVGGAISVADNPGTQTLNNNTLDYFFYDWDHGVARGIRHFGGECPSEYNSSDSQCWQVVWVSCVNASSSPQWKMSSVYGYEPTRYSARFLRETETAHDVTVSGESGGVGNLTDFSMSFEESHALNGTATAYSCTVTPAYTHYYIEGRVDASHHTNIPEENYYYYESSFHSTVPNSTNYTNAAPTNYAWSISCEGNHLSFAQNSDVFTADGATPTLYYRTANTTTSHKTATLTLTVTYAGGVTQTRTATVTVRTQCQNPTVQDANKVITYVGVTVSWLPTAESYEVSWKKDGAATWSSITVGDVTSYTITGLEYETDYSYKVSAICEGTVQLGATEYAFKTPKEPGLFVSGAIFGGGRMANVGGKTEVVVINCDSIGAIFGGNDIAGSVEGNSGVDGSTITLGVDTGDPNEYDDYGTTPNDGKVRVSSVYGGGNGYYAYNGTSFVAADEDYTSHDVAPGGVVKAMTQSNQVGEVVWTNTGSSSRTLSFPSIVKTAITVTNNKVKVDSVFGGAKNAFLTYDDWHYDGSIITINGGTVMAVFGGNNFGGDQGKGKHHVVVNGTTTNLAASIENTALTGYGRDFGIRYLFGGGNKVYGSTTNVEIFGGQCDTIFAGGNAADVYAANMTVNCAMGDGSGNTWNKVYSNAIDTYAGGVITPKTNYGWDGYTGIYNVRTLFGGNNMAVFDSKLNHTVPTITLTSGSIGTVYGGGNSGDMWGLSNDDGSGGSLVINGDVVKYGTHVKMNSATILIDNLYGGCQMSNVRYSTWVELLNGHVGTVYGGCNVSGDVGSTRINPDAPQFTAPDVPNEDYQKVFGGTYVVASGGTVYKNLFAGANGYYHCLDNAGRYIEGLNYTTNNFVGYYSPTHNETHVVVNSDATVKGNVYAGGNLARVGFTSNSVVGDNPYPQMVGLSSVRMNGGTVNGSVYGGGNMADVNGSCEVQVSGGTIDGSLYGGNDRLGKVAVPYSNRVLPETYWTASDEKTSLLEPKVFTYVRLTGNPSITNVYGGGNGDYEYFTSFEAAAAYTGPKEKVVTCDASNKPIQQCTFVDIGVNGGNATGAHIGTVYGGGDGVDVTGFVTVFLNVKSNPIGYSNVGTIYGGNNKGDLTIPADIILLNGQVNTVYGGCNEGAMTATGEGFVKTIGGYPNIGSYVRLINSYDPDGEGTTYSAGSTNYKIMDAVYGGCCMNGVTNNSLVLVDGGDFSMVPLYGGSDISGTVSGFSRVAVTGGTVGNVFGGGNGYYTYNEGNVYTIPTSGDPVLVASGVTDAPNSVNSGVDMTAGTAANLYASGNACGSEATLSNVSGGTVTTGIYGGSNAKGTVTGDIVLNVTGGLVGASTSARANVHGGGYGHETHTSGHVTVNIGATNGQTPPTYSGTAVINGDIYGGSALGQVSASNKLTQVNFYKGTINGDVYGGGLGQQGAAAVYDPENPSVIITPAVDPIAAEVSGNVEVNIYGGVFNDAAGNANYNDGTPSDGNTGGGCIYGCNNAYGTPLGDVNVNIYATDHATTPQNNYYPTLPEGGWNVTTLNTNATTQAYAIKSVFGGGNLAAYQPLADKKATVHVYNCDNTIEDVFGGGNAADVGVGTSTSSSTTITRRADTYIYIEGGRIHRVIGGGNGEDLSKPAANIFGTAYTTVYAGLINEVYGGANRQGDVDAINLTMSNPTNSSLTNSCNHQVYGKVFGCANAADYNRSVTTNILCGVGEIGELYGGSNLADIGREGSTNANVTLNLYGGVHTQVFAGSKGDLASLPGTGHTDKASNIFGNVTLNLFGGVVTNAYGGSNYNGNITGTITVNVLDVEDATCTSEALDLTNVYGASNLADYTPTAGSTTISPVVNVIHIAQTNGALGLQGIQGNVYGGGNQASVTASPQVNIGYDAATMASILTACGYTQPSGFPRGYVSGNVFGGGNQAGVTGNPVVNMRDNGTVVSGIYGGCNDNGEIDGNINVNIYGGTLGTSVASMTDGIFGGGKGNLTQTSGDVTVTIGDGTDPTVYADVYGGSAFGEVGADGKTATVNLKAGTVYGTIFGGGKGQLEDNTTNPAIPAYSATVSGSTEVAIEGGNAKGAAWGTGENAIKAAVFGGCNVNGIVLGNATVSYTGGTIGTDADNTANTYGGGLGPDTKVKGDVDVTVDGSGVYGDVYGGSAKGKVNTENGTSQSGTSKTDVTLTAGTVHGNLYGGGHGPDGNEDADVYGPITVTVEGGTATTAFGCNNNSGTPKSTVTVNIEGGTVTNVCGGGNVADYIPTTNNINSPAVNVKGGEVTNKVVGGGNAANIGSSTISCNPMVTISGGQVCTATTDAGVYGGCNTSGTVNGNITVNVTNADGNTVIGTEDALENETPANVHGGGYGSATGITGNVTVNFGTDTDDTHYIYPKLYGDLYGGSALGTVNTNSSNTTTVNVLNGSFGYVEHTIGGYPVQFGGNIYGGGLGDAVHDHPAKVYGEVHVNIGADAVSPATTPTGQADLVHCNVYGCNNAYGSPQENVYVDVYQTAHLSEYNVYTYIQELPTQHVEEYAIANVFGGGNEANYAPDSNPGNAKTPHVYVHYCENTIEYVYGGGNAADVNITNVTVEGGRYKFVFGGGNGQVSAANVHNEVNLTILGGRIGWAFGGCNMHGQVASGNPDAIHLTTGCTSGDCPCEDQPVVVENYYFGANMATIYGGLTGSEQTIGCNSNFAYKNVYAGSRLATVYGDIELTVNGGEIGNLFGGCEGSQYIQADVKKYPADWRTNSSAYDPELIEYLNSVLDENGTDLGGTGGNITLYLYGGTIGNVFGGCDFRGNVEGTITIIVDSTQTDCRLDIDYVFGGNRLAQYTPLDPTIESPLVLIKNGHVNGAVFGGSMGGNPSHQWGNGRVVSNPKVVIGDKDDATHKVRIGGPLHSILTHPQGEGNVYGGGNAADMVGNPTVIIQGTTNAEGKPSTIIEGSVFGGANLGNVEGNTNVIIVPSTPTP